MGYFHAPGGRGTADVTRSGRSAHVAARVARRRVGNLVVILLLDLIHEVGEAGTELLQLQQAPPGVVQADVVDHDAHAAALFDDLGDSSDVPYSVAALVPSERTERRDGTATSVARSGERNEPRRGGGS